MIWGWRIELEIAGGSHENCVHPFQLVHAGENPFCVLEEKPCCDTLSICVVANDPEMEGTTELTLSML